MAAADSPAPSPWPVWKQGSLAAGVAVLLAAVGWSVAVNGEAGDAHPTGLVLQHVLLMMVAPPLLVAGRPAALRGPWGIRAARGGAARDGAGVRSPGLRTAVALASWLAYYGSMAAYFLTPAYAASLRHPALLYGIEAGFVVVGWWFWSVVAGPGASALESGERPRSHAFRIGAVLSGMPFETAVGIALVLWPRPLAPGESLAATHAAGLALWLASMAASGAALGVILVRWCIDDARRGQEEADMLAAAHGAFDGQAATAVAHRTFGTQVPARPQP